MRDNFGEKWFFLPKSVEKSIKSKISETVDKTPKMLTLHANTACIETKLAVEDEYKIKIYSILFTASQNLNFLQILKTLLLLIISSILLHDVSSCNKKTKRSQPSQSSLQFT